jgi:two-component system, NarL family, nitrate/nitrite response regulator NarL
MAAQKKIKLLVGDPRPTFRDGLRLLLANHSDVNLVCEADAADQIMKKVTSHKPHVALLHPAFSQVAGRNLFLQLQRNFPTTRLLILTFKDEDEGELRALRIPSLQLVPRQTSFTQVLQWIRQAEGNGNSSAPAVSGKSAVAKGSEEAAPDTSPLSARERQVVELVSQGFKNREIAQRMFISEQTVKNHLHNIFDKLGVSDRLELALYAIHRQLQGGL